MKFELTALESQRFEDFRSKCDRQVASIQKKELVDHIDYDYLTKRTNNWTRPYLGASGGAYSFIFTPNTICRTVIVKCDVLDVCEDLTDYDQW